MARIERMVRALARLGLALAALALIASLATISYSVIRRYVFGAPVAWTDELVAYLLVASVMLAAGDALLGGEHISVDILTDRLRPGGKRIAALIGLFTVAVRNGHVLRRPAERRVHSLLAERARRQLRNDQ